MNKFQIISLIMKAVCVVYFFLISYWAIFCSEELIRAGLWWVVNMIIVFAIACMSMIFWEKK
jgi:hypothetical protein